MHDLVVWKKWFFLTCPVTKQKIIVKGLRNYFIMILAICKFFYEKYKIILIYVLKL